MDYQIRNILYATDLGPSGPKVLRHALGLARRFGAKVHIVHAMEPLGEFAHSLVESYVPEATLAKLREEGFREIREELLERIHTVCRDLEVTDAEGESLLGRIDAVQGVPYEVVMEEADRVEADLIVLGDRAHSALSEMFVGSVAHKVLMQSKVPVLLVPIEK